MPTEPKPEMLNREPNSLAGELNAASALVEEMVNFGTNVLKWYLDAQEGKRGDEPLLISALFRRTLEILDSISILVKSSSIDPCVPQLRALLEVALSLEYLLQTDTEERALSFMLVCQLHGTINELRKADRSTGQGKELRAILKKDRLTKNWPVPEDRTGAGGKMAADREQRLMDSPTYSKYEAEYQRLRKLGKEEKHRSTNPDWYALFDGPQGIEQLAHKVGLPGVYNIFYRDWSKYVHGSDIINKSTVRITPGKIEIYQLRNPVNFQSVTQSSISLAKLIYETFITCYLENKELQFRKWYAEEIETSLGDLLNITIEYK
jgi:hypothetical protein